MSDSVLTYIIIAANVYYTYLGLKDGSFMERNLFRVRDILQNKQYKRLISSGFLHNDWMHLFFNMYTLFYFGGAIETVHGAFFYSILYFLSLLGGDLLSLLIHRNQPGYAALGASGAVNGIVFASVLLFPGFTIRMFFIPIDIPSWVYAVGYTLYTIYGMRNQSDNIGHDAHLGGAVIGILLTLGFFPETFALQPILITCLLVPSIAFITISAFKPELIGMPVYHKKKHVPSDDHYNQIRAEKQRELDRILEKINATGMKSLTDIEKRFLDLNT